MTESNVRMNTCTARGDELTPWQDWLLILGVLVLPVAVAAWAAWDNLKTREVVSSTPIGRLVELHPAPQGLHTFWVIETDQGFFPIESTITMAKGTALMLDLRASKRRYVCDAARTLCVLTRPLGFSAPMQASDRSVR